MRDGAAAPRKDVRIEIHDRDSGHTLAWRLTGAVPIKFDAPEFNASGNDVAIEELVLGCERLELL